MTGRGEPGATGSYNACLEPLKGRTLYRVTKRYDTGLSHEKALYGNSSWYSAGFTGRCSIQPNTEKEGSRRQGGTRGQAGLDQQLGRDQQPPELGEEKTQRGGYTQRAIVVRVGHVH